MLALFSRGRRKDSSWTMVRRERERERAWSMKYTMWVGGGTLWSTY